MPSEIWFVLAGACYILAMVLELVSLRARFGWHRPALLVLAAAGLIAHTGYLGYRAAESATSIWESPADWYLVAAWVLAAVYLTATFTQPTKSTGLFVLPLVLVLVGVSLLASDQPFAPEGVHQFWNTLHGSVLLAGTVTVCIGFLAGLMYLIQSSRLKRKLPAVDGFRLPSLEQLERTNSRALGLSTVLIAIGFASGLLLAKWRSQDELGHFPWTDPVVLSLTAMFGWLIVAEAFRWIYPAARAGRKVAYLTIASFVFLVIMLFSVLALDTVHGISSVDKSDVADASLLRKHL